MKSQCHKIVDNIIFVLSAAYVTAAPLCVIHMYGKYDHMMSATHPDHMLSARYHDNMMSAKYQDDIIYTILFPLKQM